MIEFILIFALGFLAAAILAMLVTPAIYNRVVKLTEKRIEATVPLSHAEIKGKADLMRAGFASETAKLNAKLENERSLRTESKLRADKLQSDLAFVAGEKKLADQHIEELVVQAGDLRSDDRKKQQLVDSLSETVRQYERIKSHDNMELARLHNDLMTISTEVETMRIDLAANSAESESLRAQVDSLNMQRDQLLNDIETLAEAAQAVEKSLHAEQESHNETRIELAGSQSSLADREALLEQTFDQIEKQKTELSEQVESHQRERDKLLADIAAADEAARGIQQNFESEQQAHKTTRIELAEVQSSLAEREAEFVKVRDEMQDQKRQLSVEIEALNLERSRLEREIEVAAQTAQHLEENLQQEQDAHRGTRIELTARQALLDDRMRQIAEADKKIEAHRIQLNEADEATRQTLQELKQAQRHGEMLAGRVDNAKAALDKSKSAERTSREKISALKAEGERLQRQLKDAQNTVSAREKDVQTAKAEQARREEERQATIRHGSDLEQQIATLKTELHESHASALQYQEQLKKMRNELNRLHRHEALAQANLIEPLGQAIAEPDNRDVNGAVRGRLDDLRHRHAALVDKLKNADDESADPGMREEMAAIAAAVVGLSGQREGKTSPIHNIISDASSEETTGGQRVSLASRAKSELEN